jgi:hypothetical protein
MPTRTKSTAPARRLAAALLASTLLCPAGADAATIYFTHQGPTHGLAKVSTVTGRAVPIATTLLGSYPHAIAVDTDGMIYLGLGWLQLAKFNPATGQATLVGTLNQPVNGLDSLEISSDGKLYGNSYCTINNAGHICLHEINKGNAEFVGLVKSHVDDGRPNLRGEIELDTAGQLLALGNDHIWQYAGPFTPAGIERGPLGCRMRGWTIDRHNTMWVFQLTHSVQLGCTDTAIPATLHRAKPWKTGALTLVGPLASGNEYQPLRADTRPNDPCLAHPDGATESVINATPGAGTVAGTERDDVMNGTEGDDRLAAWKCDDHLLGKGGNDSLGGSWGDDKIEGGDGHDMIYGEWGDDVLLAGDDLNTDHLYGGPGNDYLSTGQGKGGGMWGEAGLDTYVGASNYIDEFWVDGSPDRGASPSPALHTSDVIESFEAIDKIFLKGSYTLANPTKTPADGQYSVYPGDGDLTGTYVVTWNSPADTGYHDVVVKSGDPNGRIFFYQ